MSRDKTPRETGPRPGAPKNKQDFEQEQQGLRELIGSFRREPEGGDDGGFYRNVGRFISRPLLNQLMNQHGSDDKGR